MVNCLQLVVLYYGYLLSIFIYNQHNTNHKHLSMGDYGYAIWFRYNFFLVSICAPICDEFLYHFIIPKILCVFDYDIIIKYDVIINIIFALFRIDYYMITVNSLYLIKQAYNKDIYGCLFTINHVIVMFLLSYFIYNQKNLLYGILFHMIFNFGIYSVYDLPYAV